MNLEKIVRPNIWKLKAYSSARDEFKGEASVFLDANENPLRESYNRYPDPRQLVLKEKIGAIKNIPLKNIFLGNGSDEPIDLVYRVFCESSIDNVVAIEPTYGMYQVCADINNVEYRKIELNADFSVNVDKVLRATDEKTKIIFLCSPNNPTGNLLKEEDINKLLTSFQGIVVLDEAYIDFAEEASYLKYLNKYPNLIILQTFSKAWGLAAVRLGMAFASTEIIELLSKVKYPYNINQLTQEYVFKALEQVEEKEQWVKTILTERTILIKELSKLPFVKKIHPSDANFVLVQVDDPNSKYQQLAEQGIVVRNRNNVTMCEGCLRITIGTESENNILIEALKKL